MKYINLNNLPKNKNNISWKDSTGCKCDFIYNEIKGTIEIINFKRLNNRTYLTIKYKTKTYDISSDNLCKCQIGGVLNKYDGNFKLEIGDRLNDSKRDISIIDRSIRIDKNNHSWKYYKYKCNKDFYEDWIVENSLLKGIGCSLCTNQTVVPGINNLATTDPWMADYLVDKEDTNKYTSKSGKKVKVKCPDCGRTKYIIISNLQKRHSISCICSDGKSYPEKFTHNILEQLDENFICQYNKSHSQWCDEKLYDFYLINHNIIIEVNGWQHVKDTTWKTKEEQQNIDEFKRELALNNGINKYIQLDCYQSYKDYIKNSILNSELSKMFDLSNINWDKADEFATKNLVKTVCEYYETHKGEMLLKDMAENFHISYTTFNRYMKQGNKLNWCNYNKKDNYKNTYKVMKSPRSKAIEVVETGDIFESASELEKKSEELYGIKFNHTHVSMVCSGKQNKHKGFHFKYVD